MLEAAEYRLRDFNARRIQSWWKRHMLCKNEVVVSLQDSVLSLSRMAIACNTEYYHRRREIFRPPKKIRNKNPPMNRPVNPAALRIVLEWHLLRLRILSDVQFTARLRGVSNGLFR